VSKGKLSSNIIFFFETKSSTKFFLVTLGQFSWLFVAPPIFFFGDFEVDFTIFGAKKVVVVSNREFLVGFTWGYHSLVTLGGFSRFLG